MPINGMPDKVSNLILFVGSDPKIKTVGEQRVFSFSVALNRKNSRGEKQKLWVRVNAWGKLADIAEQYIKKGSLV